MTVIRFKPRCTHSSSSRLEGGPANYLIDHDPKPHDGLLNNSGAGTTPVRQFPAGPSSRASLTWGGIGVYVVHESKRPRRSQSS